MLSRLFALLDSLPARFDAWLAANWNGSGDPYGDAYEAIDEEREKATREGRERRF